MHNARAYMLVLTPLLQISALLPYALVLTLGNGKAFMRPTGVRNHVRDGTVHEA